MKAIKFNTGDFCRRDEDTLEKIILLRSVAGSMAIILFYLVYGIIIGDLQVAVLSGGAMLAYGFCYIFVSITEGSALSKRIVIGVIMASVISGFFAQGGLFGITALNMCGLIILISIVLSGYDRQIFIASYIVMVLFFMWAHLFQKNWIADYRQNHSEAFLMAEILVYIAYILYIGYLYKSEYEKNRKMVTKTNKELEEANTEISTQNNCIMANNNQLKALVAELQKERNKALEANCRLKKANGEIDQKNKYISTINAQLEAIVAERTSNVKELNRKIVDFAQYNAHRIRGPLARIIGLVQIMTLDFKNNKIYDRQQFGFFIENLRQNAGELDEMVRAVTALLHENDISIEETEMNCLFHKFTKNCQKESSSEDEAVYGRQAYSISPAKKGNSWKEFR